MENKYDPKTTPWEINETDYPAGGSPEEQARFLVRYAILAPSSHNSQPWEFSINNNEIALFADTSRWLRVSDTDQRELFVSAGCALENLLIAAEHFGFGHSVEYFPEGEDGAVADVRLYPGASAEPQRDRSLFDMITFRSTNHNPCGIKRVPTEEMTRIRECCREEGIHLYTTTDAGNETEIRQQIDDLILRADAIQLTDPAYKKELAWWVGEGALGASWLMGKVSKLAITHIDISKGQTKKDSHLLLSAPALVILCTEKDDRRSQVITGQVYERIALTAARLGIAIHPMSQILEVPDIKTELYSLLPDSAVIPQHSFRLGYAEPEKNHTPRRPVEEMIVEDFLTKRKKMATAL